MIDRFILEPERHETTGVSVSTWSRMEKRNEAPKRRQISPGRIAWLESEILEWMEARPVIDSSKASDGQGSLMKSTLICQRPRRTRRSRMTTQKRKNPPE